MDEKLVKLTIGSLLHDIGKVVYRSDSESGTHSYLGYKFLKEGDGGGVKVGLQDTEILNQVLYHHKGEMKGAKISNDDLAYITYIADNIASGADRRQAEDNSGKNFLINTPLTSVFDVLKQDEKSIDSGKIETTFYKPYTFKDGINFPTKDEIKFDSNFYNELKIELANYLKNFSYTSEYVNSLIELLESYLLYVPSSTNVKELRDISLFDHLKMTAAISGCLYYYLNDKNDTNYKLTLFENDKVFYNEKAFLLYSIDISGIQSFIYTIADSKALKNLRARSFYLEIFMTHIVDSLLEKLELSRANLIYSGGGHSYLLLPNTENVKNILDAFESDINHWLLETFDIALFMASGYTECSANDLFYNDKTDKNIDNTSVSQDNTSNEKNKEEDSRYTKIFREVSSKLSAKKSSRYSLEDIQNLNNEKHEDNERECDICKRSSKLKCVDGKYICEICSAIENLSNIIIKKHSGEEQYFYITTENEDENLLPLL